jgi:hypothetical protein
LAGSTQGLNALQIAMLEDRIKEYVVSFKVEMETNQNKAIKNLQKKYENSTRRIAKGLDKKIQRTDSNVRKNIAASNMMDTSRVASVTNSFFDGGPAQSSAQGTGGHNILSTKLREDLQEAIAMEGLNCRPVEGADVPVRQTKYNRAGELVMIEDLEGIQRFSSDAGDNGYVFDHLEDIAGDLFNVISNPAGFKAKKNARNYIIEEDIGSIQAPVDPNKINNKKDGKKEKKEKKAKELFENKIENEPKVTEEQRQKTIDLMIKMLGSNIKDAKEEAKELTKFRKQTEGKIK